MNLFGLGTSEIILILLVIILLFGKDRLPELARSIGKSFRELKAGFEKSSDVVEGALNETAEASVATKAKEVERQRCQLQKTEAELAQLKKGTPPHAGTRNGA